MRKERKHYAAEEKVAIRRRHLLDKVPVSDLCEQLGLQPTVFSSSPLIPDPPFTPLVYFSSAAVV
jgi:hypothetical protein